MKIGKVPESVLKRSCLKQIKHHRPEVLLGAGIGEDCAALELAEDEELVLSTDPITGTVQDIGTLAVVVTTNDLASAGAEPIGIMLTVLLPDGTEEETLKTIMSEVAEACEKADIEILGGHTEVTAAVNQPILSVTGVAKVKKGRLIQTGGAKPGMDVILTKWVGIEGTAIIAKEKEEELLSRLPEWMVEDAKSLSRYLSIQKEAMIAAEHGAAALHDVTEGGVFGALWELAEASGTGLEIDLRRIPIRQETVEIAEHFGINPYELISSGSLLIATNDGVGLLIKLSKNEIPAQIIGKVTEGNDRVLLNNGEKRFLEPPKTDALYEVV